VKTPGTQPGSPFRKGGALLNHFSSQTKKQIMKTNESVKTKERTPLKSLFRGGSKTVSIDGNDVMVVQREPVFQKRVSAAVREERAAFISVTRLLLPMSGFMNEAYKEARSEFAGLNKVISENMKNAVQGVYPALSLHYAKLLLTKGTLPIVGFPITVPCSSGKLWFSWIDNSGISQALDSDLVYVAAYCEKLNHWIYCSAAANRSTRACTLDVAAFHGHAVHAYIGCMSANRARTSDSRYVGRVNIL
jgi:hypothetical protein